MREDPNLWSKITLTIIAIAIIIIIIIITFIVFFGGGGDGTLISLISLQK